MYLDNKTYLNDMDSVTKLSLPWENLNNANVLITGANGLISSFFIDCLMYRNKIKKSNINVYALCRNKDKAKKRFENYVNDNNFHFIFQDVCEPLKADITFDYIIHAASNAHPLAFATKPVETMKANVLGCINLLDYAVTNKPKKFMFFSSTEVYGQNNIATTALKEDDFNCIDFTNIRSAYPESKRMSETLCTCYSKQYNINTSIVRPGYIYGATMIEESSKADAQFIRNAVNGENIIMKSAGNQLRSYCYLSDMVSAMFYTLLLGENGNAYNVANNNCKVTIKEFAETLADMSGVKVIYENPDDVEKSGYSLVGNGVLNADKLEKLGWKASVGIKDGLRRTLGILKTERS